MQLKTMKFLTIAGAITGAFVALSLYAHDRNNAMATVWFGWVPNILGGNQTGLITGSLPSLLFVLIFSGLSISINGWGRKSVRFSIALWTLLALVYEGLQFQGLGAWKIPGVFDVADVAFIIGGALFAWVVVSTVVKYAQRSPSREAFRVFRNAVLLTLGVAGSMATNVEFGNADPVYLSYDDLRKAVRFDNTTAFTETGKIYTYQFGATQYLLVNSRNQGIHIYNNTNPSAPAHLGFIHIPGNLDMEIRGGFLYADSYVDLVTIDLRDPDNVHEVARQQDIFPYNPYQNISEEDVTLVNVDRKKGVVVGYTMKKSARRTQ